MKTLTQGEATREMLQRVHQFDLVISAADVILESVMNPEYPYIKPRPGETTLEFHSRAYADFLNSRSPVAFLKFHGRLVRITRKDAVKKAKQINKMLAKRAKLNKLIKQNAPAK